MKLRVSVSVSDSLSTLGRKNNASAKKTEPLSHAWEHGTRGRQFPVRVAFAMTINKAQGQTLQRVGVYLPQPCFG